MLEAEDEVLDASSDLLLEDADDLLSLLPLLLLFLLDEVLCFRLTLTLAVAATAVSSSVELEEVAESVVRSQRPILTVGSG